MNAIRVFISRTREYGLRYVLQMIFKNKIYRRIDGVIRFLTKGVFLHLPLKEIIILESHNDFDSNGGAFYDYLIQEGYNNNYRIVWLLRNPKPGVLPRNVLAVNMFRPSVRREYYLCTAKYLVTCHMIQGTRRQGQLSYYLTHGPVGLKAFKGKVVLPETLTYCLCPSEYLAQTLADQYMLGYPNKKQIILGYPCHDILYEKSQGDLHKLSRSSYKKVILWMPTFRKSIDFHRNDSIVEQPMGIPIIGDIREYEILNDRMAKADALMIIKIHPMQDLTKVKIRTMSNIIVLDRISVKELDVEVYRLMKDTDAIITDYSSVAYDYLHLNKPIGYTMDDANGYTGGFIVEDPTALMAGPIIYTPDDFSKFIDDVIEENDCYAKARMELLSRVFKYHDGDSSRRLAEHMGLIKYTPML